MNSNKNSTMSNKFQVLGDKIKNASSAVYEKAGEVKEIASNSVNKIRSNISEQVSNQNSFLGKLNNNYKTTSSKLSSFAESNSTISKFVFIFFVFIIFVLLFKFGVYLLTLYFTPSKSPIVMDGMTYGTSYIEYQVNPSKSDPKPILRSINEDQGMEFTWNVWIYIENVFGTTGNRKIFSKGGGEKYLDETISSTNMMDISGSLLNVSPGLFLKENENTLMFVLNTFDESEATFGDLPYEIIEIPDIPIQKWVCCTTRVQNRTIDVYINGILMKRVNMSKVPRQNYGNIHVGDYNNGLNGFISSLRYFNYAIGPGKIQDIMYLGPNTKMIGEKMETTPPYLSIKWYLNN